MDTNYADVIAGALSPDGTADADLRNALAARTLMVCLFREAVQAKTQAATRGAPIAVTEYFSTDGFRIEANGRKVKFERCGGEPIKVERFGFPRSLVPTEVMDFILQAPVDPREVPLLAAAQMKDAVRILFAAA